MTEEQIKQNAEAYAINSGYEPLPKCGWIDCTAPDIYGISVDAYIEGAHSRDEEIRRLRIGIESATKVMVYREKELNKLRNPWISVEERLPEIDKTPKWRLFVDKWITDLLVKFPNGSYTVASFNTETKEWRNEIPPKGSIITEITHWMPIPELKEK